MVRAADLDDVGFSAVVEPVVVADTVAAAAGETVIVFPLKSHKNECDGREEKWFKNLFTLVL